MKLKRDWFQRERLHTKEMKSPCNTLNSSRFCWEWSKNTSRLLSSIPRLRTKSKCHWLKNRFKNWFVYSQIWTQLWTLPSRRRTTNLEELRLKKSKKELTPLRKSNFLFYLVTVRTFTTQADSTSLLWNGPSRKSLRKRKRRKSLRKRSNRRKGRPTE